MVKILVTGLVLPLAMMFGCEKKADQAGSGSAPTAQKDKHGHEVGSQDEHEHATEDAGHEHRAGEKHDLGTVKVGEFDVTALYSGTLTPGKQVDIDLTFKGESAKVVTIRAWIGAKDAKGSIKAKAAPEGSGFHAEVEAPDPLPEGAALWVEIETNQGQELLGSLALKR